MKISSLSLHSKFLVGLAVASMVIAFILAAGFYVHIRHVLEGEIEDKAKLVFAQVDSIQHYVRQVLRPRMYEELNDSFVIEAMSSSFISRHIMGKVNDDAGPYIYRRVAVNSRNPDFEARPEELALLSTFQEDPDRVLWQGYRELGGVEYFVMARPVSFDASCMYCHGRPEDAPRELIDLYGTRGFGHAEGAVDGLDLVGVPFTAAVVQIQGAVMSYLVIFCTAMLLFFASTNLVFKRVVVNNLKVLTSLFKRNFSDDKGTELLRQVEKGDEIDTMIQGMERLGEHLYETRAQLQDYAANLEHKVADRTRELGREARSREADVNLFVHLLAGLNRSQTRAELWRQSLPPIVDRFNLEKAAYVCALSTHSSYSWPPCDRDPELPQDWLSLLSECRVVVTEGRAFIPVESSQGYTEGLLCLYRKEGAVFRPQDHEVLRALGRQLGVAVENLNALDNLMRHMDNLQSVFEGISDPLLLVDRSGRAVTGNQAARTLAQELGGPEAEQGNLLPLLCAGHGEGADCDLGRALAGDGFVSREVSHSGRMFAVSFYPVQSARDAGPDRIIVAVRDVTAEKDLMAQMTRSEKLASVGKLAAGLAHEINNPLGVILCYAELLKAGLTDPQQRQDLEVIMKHTRQAQRVLRDLLNFARPKAGTAKPVDLAAEAASVVQVFGIKAEKRGVRLRLEALGGGAPLVRMAPHALEHILANLLLNALDVVPDNTGDILVQTVAEADSGEVVLRVEDNGPGIPPADLPRIFDPFYTTKEVNKGTGLGLTVVYGFVSDLGGRIEAGNRKEGGAVFDIRLPVAAPDKPGVEEAA
ncbi:sensor histidine kinase [hydrocarbon metagenome]|uniref:Sensor histidine kinase n=1 Tax=hydrocarbon metagenome TaxID=938273 RepID=A0A0W8G6X1_9ZZZZ